MRVMSSFILGGLAIVTPATLFAQQPNDAQIAAIVVTANQVDIDAGKRHAFRTGGDNDRIGFDFE